MKQMIKTTLVLFILTLAAGSLLAQKSIVGVWKTIDDETGEAKSHMEIAEKGGKFYGKIVKLLQDEPDKTCDECPGDKKNKPLVGMEILWDMKVYKDYWSNGKIMDPANGKTYKCSIWQANENELTVRGYIGFSLLGRSQAWYKVE